MIKLVKTWLNTHFKLLKKREYYRYLFLLGKYFSHPRLKTELVNFLNFKIFAVDCLSFVFQFKEIFLYEAYKFYSTKKEPVIIDCGANIGVSCLFFKKLYPGSRITAIEADSHIAKLLKRNLNTNNFQDVEVIAKAVWVNNDGIDFGADGADGGSILNSLNKNFIPSIRLKNIIAKYEEIDFLKIDIEGAETSVIQDCDDVLYKVKNIFIEYHSFLNSAQSLDVILSILTKNGYRYFIKQPADRDIPFMNRINKNNPEMDLQLNIFAYK